MNRYSDLIKRAQLAVALFFVGPTDFEVIDLGTPPTLEAYRAALEAKGIDNFVGVSAFSDAGPEALLACPLSSAAIETLSGAVSQHMTKHLVGRMGGQIGQA